MRELLPVIDGWAAEGHGAARAVVVRTYGSAPRREGSTMLLADDGRIEGSVSGGCVEGATAELLAAARESGEQRLARFGVSDGQAWAVGLSCGGTIDVLLQPSVPAAALAAARETGSDRGAARVVVTPLPPGSPPPSAGSSELGPAAPMEAELLVYADGRLEGTLGDDAADEAVVRAALAHVEAGTSGTLEVAGRQLFLEAYPAAPRLVVVGAVPVTAALSRLAAELGYETVVIEARSAFATPGRAGAGRLIVAWPDEAFEQLELGPADALVVLSHDPKFDDPAVLGALARGCRYVGVMGSRKTQAARRERLLEQGASEADLARLHAPIGLDLGGRAPAETALAILAEIVAVRHGGTAAR